MIERAVIGVRQSIGPAIMAEHFEQNFNKKERKWSGRRARVDFWVFSMTDGKKTHQAIAKILHIPEIEVRDALFRLAVDGIIHFKEGSMDVRLLQESFDKILQNGELFASSFYTRLFETGRQLYHSDYLEQMFLKGGNIKDQDKIMKKQYNALIGALAFVVAGVVKKQSIREGLLTLAQKHKGYGVTRFHYSLVGTALIETFIWYWKDILHEEWTEDLQGVWSSAYTFVVSIMEEVYTA